MSLLFFLAYSRTSLFTIITTRHILNNCKSYYNRHFSHVFPYRSKLTLNHTTHFHIYHYSNRSSHSIDALHSFNVVPSYTRSSPSKTSDFIHTRTSSSAHAHISILATPPQALHSFVSIATFFNLNLLFCLTTATFCSSFSWSP